jgi:putative oxidoreductase
MALGRLALRATIGGLFVGHGTQKLFGWFGGHGLDATAGMFEKLQLHPPRRNAIAAGASETAGGALLALGLVTPLAASTLTGTMLTAIHRVHLKKGVWVMNGGYEYNLVLIAAVLALAEVGPGPLSLDHVLGIERRGTLMAALALAGAAAGAYAVDVAARASAPGADEPQHGEPSHNGHRADAGASAATA